MAAHGAKKTTTRTKPTQRVASKRADTRAKPAPFSPAFDTQRGGASLKDLLLFELQRARVAVNAALQGVAGGAAERVVRPGGWTIRELVLHLAFRDRVRLEEFDTALAGTPASWVALDEATMATVNETHLTALRALSWDEAVRLLHITRAELLERLETVPSEPNEVWGEAHAFGAMLWMLPKHDRHHADQIKHARIQG